MESPLHVFFDRVASGVDLIDNICAEFVDRLLACEVAIEVSTDNHIAVERLDACLDGLLNHLGFINTEVLGEFPHPVGDAIGRHTLVLGPNRYNCHSEAAWVVDRDVKNVHEELCRLAQLGIIFFEEDGQSKRPVVWFDELVINLPFDPDAGDTAAAAP